MAIQAAGGTYRNDSYPGVTTYPVLLDRINTTLVAAGWTSTAVPAFNKITYTGQPLNNDTVTLNSVVYTWKSAINNATPREVAIGVDADTSWANFVACVIAGAGSGSAYSSATTANPTFTASIPAAGTVNITTLASGTGSLWGISMSESTANAAFYYTDAGGTPRTAFNGYKWTSAATPSGIKIKVYGFLRDCDSAPALTQCRFILLDESEVFISPSTYLIPQSLGTSPSDKTIGGRLGGNSSTLPSSTWRVIANKYQFFAFADTLYSGAGIFVAAGIPWIPDFFYPKTITAATTATPIAITTSTAHGWTTGDVVSISGINGLSGGNGNFTVTVTSTTTATLTGSVGTGTYSSGGYAAKVGVAISNIGWMSNAFSGSTTWLYLQTSPSDWVTGLINGSTTDPNGSYSTGTPSLIIPVDASLAEGANSQLWYNSDVLISEPLYTAGTTNAGTSWMLGQLWDSFFHCKAEAGGTLGTFDSKNWYVLTDNAIGSSASREGALVVRVP